MRGTGYNTAPASEIYELMRHRRRQLEALSMIARRDDAKHELERELAQLDADIAAGVEELERRDRAELDRLHQSLAARVESHRDS